MADQDEEELWDDDEELDEGTAAADEPVSLPVVFDADTVQLPMAWATTHVQVEEVRKHKKMFNLKHGLFVNVPMVCKSDECPLKGTCTIPASRRPKGDRCPIEIAAILDRYDKYIKELSVGDDDFFDQSQVKDLVDIEIKLMRANGVLAINADFIEMVIVGIDSNGNKLMAPQLHKATEYEEKLLARKAKILSDLNSTRKQKDRNREGNDPSSFASQLMQRALRAQAKMGMVMDVDAEEVYEDNDRIDITPDGEEDNIDGDD